MILLNSVMNKSGKRRTPMLNDMMFVLLGIGALLLVIIVQLSTISSAIRKGNKR